ncbi:RRP12-like protein [Tanacetum coccineum]
MNVLDVNYIQAWNSFSHGADCMGAALVALGPETFLKFLPLNLKSAKHEQEGRIHLARSIDGFVYSIWSLLPSFCNFPLDTDESFKDFEKALCRALQEQPDLQGVICSSLQNLIRKNKQVIEGENEPATLQKLQLVILRSSAREILPTLSGIFIKSSKYDDGGSLQCSLTVFQETMEKLLKVTEEAGKVQNTKGSSSMEVDSSSSETSLSQTRLGKDLSLNSNPGIFRFVVCQADEAPNDDISETIFSTSSGPIYNVAVDITWMPARVSGFWKYALKWKP